MTVTLKSLKGATNVLIADLTADGIDPSSTVGGIVIKAWLGQSIGQKCTCGNELHRWEGLNSAAAGYPMCNACRLRELRSRRDHSDGLI